MCVANCSVGSVSMVAPLVFFGFDCCFVVVGPSYFVWVSLWVNSGCWCVLRSLCPFVCGRVCRSG